jgi:uncharacterized membrane protein YhaH (DUF805 family)
MHAIFFDIANGRLARLPYFGHWLLLVALAIVAAIVVGISFGVSEHMIHADFKGAHEKLSIGMLIPLIICFVVIGFATMFGLLNLMAKRIRDIGLPGWPVVIGLTIVLALISALSHGLGQALHGVLFLALVFVPTDAVGNRAAVPESKRAMA